MNPYIAAINRYTDGVLNGSILACEWVKLAVQRHRDDLEKQKSPEYPYRFDEFKASRICRFIEMLPHVKGDLAGELIHLEDWQCFVLGVPFGWLKKDTGHRRFRKVYIEVPRGNAKSTLSSGVGLYMAFVDGQGGADVYSAATTKDQARIVFADAQLMSRRSPDFREAFGVDVLAHSIVQLETGSKFLALSADDNSLDGLNIHLAVVDELHAHKTRGVHDVLETGIGKRLASMLWEITTAGFNRSGICYEVRDYVKKFLQNIIQDDQYFGIIFTIDEGVDDWTTIEALKKANPNWGISVEPDSVLATQRKAMQMASATNNFLTKHLNVWVNQDTAWMDMRAWDRCKDETLKIEDFAKDPCWIALDLATTTDIAAMSIVFKRNDDFYVFGRHYVPWDAIENSVNSQYSGWERTGRLIATDGAVIDFKRIEDDVLELCGRLNVQQVIKDPWQSAYIGTRMQDQGLTVVDVRQTVQALSAPMKELEAKVLSGKFHHDGDQVLAWMASNVVAHLDVKENIYPRKARPENKIDGIVALIMALSQAILGEKGPSVYSGRGLLAA